MKREFEYTVYTDTERLEMLENRAAELERLLGRAAPGYHAAEHGTGAYPVQQAEPTPRGRHAAPPASPPTAVWESGSGYPGSPSGYPNATPWYAAGGYRAPEAEYTPEGFDTPDYEDEDEDEDEDADGYPDEAEPDEPDARTEVLINHGRRNVRQPGRPGWLKHWRAIVVAIVGVAVGSFVVSLVLPGASPSWPASVAHVQSEISVACQNPNVVSEPSQVNFACAKTTRQILWVFSLLTSDDNPNFRDPANGRKGLEPITPAQGGDVAWSLNLHHPYNPASPTDSLEVAARAINDIIGGATLTGSNGTPEVQPGLESNPSNCARYTGSSALVTRQGFPAVCAQPVSSPAGQAALVSDVFEQWMVGTPARVAADAGVLFENADNPGDSRVQAILNSLSHSGL
jgi:hypothetical protein